MRLVKGQGSRVKGWLIILGLVMAVVCRAEVSDPAGVFAEGNAAFESGEYEKSVEVYTQLVPDYRSAALLYNLGNAEYELGDYPMAILHYERARVLAPANPDIRANLKLARDAAQVTSPELNWAERLALAWPVNCWAWLGAVSFWACLALVLLPGMWGWRGPLRKAAVALTGVLFVVCAVALSGYHRLGRLGVSVAEEAALKLSPTSSAPAKDYLKPGESAFVERHHGDFYFVETDGKSGWVSAEDFKPVWD